MNLTRQGYYYLRSSAGVDQIELELYVYTGTQTTSRPVSPTAILLASAIPPIDNPSGTNQALFNLAPYINDEIDIELKAALTSRTTDEGAWFDFRSRTITGGTPGAWSGFTQGFGVPGYADYNAGSLSPTTGDEPFLLSRYQFSNTNKYPKIYLPEGERLIVPCADWGSVTLEEGTFYNGTTHTTAITTPGSATTSTGAVKYIQEPVAEDTTELYKYISSGPAYQKQFEVERVAANDDASKITFVNAKGALQEMWFFGRVKRGFSTQGITSKRDTKLYSTYDKQRPQYIDYNKNGKNTITLNSGWVTEHNNIWFRELLMSQQIWWLDPLDITGTSYIPVRVANSNMQLKSQRWDKVINYTIEFEYAIDYTLA